MDKVKINSVNWKTRQCGLYIDDANVPSLTVNLNDMTVSDGDILATELNKYGQTYKSDCLARIHHRQSLCLCRKWVWICRWCDCSIIPETPEVPVDPETPIDPEENPVKLICNMQKFTTALA